MQGWVCALGVLCLFGVTSGSLFRYHRGTFRRTDDCNICFADDCLVLDQARCDYYVETDNLLDKDDDTPAFSGNEELRKECDSLLHDHVEKALLSATPMECIPFISRYTDCNKENVCIGCKSCSCTAEGKWNCSSSQQCHTKDAELNIDHRVLVLVLENMMDDTKRRKSKRSVTGSPEELKNVTTLSLEQMSEWIYGVKPLEQKYSLTQAHTTSGSTLRNGSEVTETVTTAMSTETATTKATANPPGVTTKAVKNDATTIEPSTMSDSDYVAFDEVLRSIAVDNKSYNRRKLPLDNELSNKTFDIDYMLMDDENINNITTENATADELSYVINFMRDEEVTEPPIDIDESTKIVIDLLETVARGAPNTTEAQDFEVYNKDEDIRNGFENTNDIIEYNAVNIMKREITENSMMNVTNALTFIINTTNTTYVTEDAIDLTETVLVPLNKIINDKKRELEELKRIKGNLLKYAKVDDRGTEDNKLENITSNTFFSIYNLAVNSDPEIDFRKTLKATKFDLDKYTKKLKNDIYEVIRDITLIQKYTKTALPDDLKNLIIAMKRYVYRNKIKDIKFDKTIPKKGKSDRRRMDESLSRCALISFKDCIILIIEAVDKDMPKSHALSVLSPSARKILKSIIKDFYTDEYAAVGLRVHDPDYNMTTDLKQIGGKWQEMTARIVNSSPFVTLYRMKLLHFVLTMDVSKMVDALALVDFAHSRRMFPSLDNVSDDVLDKINNGLKAIHNKIQIIIRYYQKKPKPAVKPTIRPRTDEETTINSLLKAIDSRKKKKRSFIKHIRSLLKSSKKDIAELLHRKVPKSEIVKQLARKKLDELSEKRYSEYQETMKRWQNNLDLSPRIKRAMPDHFKARIKNIIPNYLRHKVNKGIKDKKKNATEYLGWKANERNKRKKRKNRRNTTTTTLKTSEGLTPKKLTTRAMTTTAKINVTQTTKAASVTVTTKKPITVTKSGITKASLSTARITKATLTTAKH
ncbi:uncharacterized protein LOC113494413 [Trichoplusia ni]|uniref:Uncharacterized protein LOC113494413 n=1 Tax=Trichoplusia ni TaxID=7111 RepID=A0A7E5VK07_TRINI|nr:uncharacterized protein LOC113494413 [Trichoplusia ni]